MLWVITWLNLQRDIELSIDDLSIVALERILDRLGTCRSSIKISWNSVTWKKNHVGLVK